VYRQGIVTADPVYRPRRRLLAHDGGLVGVLRYYDGAAAQPLHAHERTQISFLLLGSMREVQGARDYDPAAGSVGFKPAGCLHADQFGRDGALILAIETDEPGAPTRSGWAVHADDKGRAALTRLAVDTSGSALAAEVMHDLLATVGEPALDSPRRAPQALEIAREQLHDEPEDCRIEAIADRAGFERTHFAHLFRRHFGLPPSLYRARQMTAKATRSLLDDATSVADAAFAGGFADHSHYTKTLRRFTGLSPRQLRATLT
jgi:AraC family transcriptional regulator